MVWEEGKGQAVERKQWGACSDLICSSELIGGLRGGREGSLALAICTKRERTNGTGKAKTEAGVSRFWLRFNAK